MNPELSQSFKDIFNGFNKAQFNIEVRSARFKDVLIATLILFLFLLGSAMVLGDNDIVLVLFVGLMFIAFTYVYHRKTDIKRVDLKAIFFYVIYAVIFLPIIYFYCGRFSIAAALLLIQAYFCMFFILKLLPAFCLAMLTTGAWYVLYMYYDFFENLGMKTARSEHTDAVFTVAGFFIAVLTIGSLIRKTIGAYDKEQEQAKKLFDDYNKKLYKAGKRNAFNDRYLLSNVATLGVLTEKGDLPGFTAVAFSVDNEEVLETISHEARAETFEVFSRKIHSVIDEDEIFVRQEKHKFALILNTINEKEVKDKLDDLIATINMTIFEHLPKDRLRISVGYSIHTAKTSTSYTMQRATDNMFVAKQRGGNCRVGGND